ncbi:MAG: DUF1598 domain-containing protein [Pirellulaceae bacterium]
MSQRRVSRSPALLRAGWRLWVSAAALVLLVSTISWAGNNGNNFGAVGGVLINAEGVLTQPTAEDVKLIRERYQHDFKPAIAELNQPVEMRKISLRQIEAAIAKSDKDNSYFLPDEIRFLAGLQRIQYVFVYPEQNDIVLAGPGEGWKLDNGGNYVGVTTGRPVLRLEDLMVALRTVDDARQGGITVSIDPTAEGRRRYEQFARTQKRFSPAFVAGAEEAFGPQTITITGVPATSRFARMLVASDFKMKQIGLRLTDSGVQGLPSYLELLAKQRAKPTNIAPRWWLACNYEPVGKSPDGLAFELRGPGVKVMAEDDLVAGDGSAKGTGKASSTTQKWASLMTEKYDELAAREPAFGDLRNLMDLCVVAALIAKEDLLGKAGLEIPTMMNEDSKLQLTQWLPPKQVATRCGFVRGSGEIITASGGVEITSWHVADRTVESPEVGALRAKSAKPGSMWWN